MTKFVAEKNFFTNFQAFNTYFLEKIMNRNWGYLIYEGSTDHYIPSPVEKFYNSFTSLDNHVHRIHINWRRERMVVDLQLLSDLNIIPLALRLNRIPMRVEEYMSLIGENCRIAIQRG